MGEIIIFHKNKKFTNRNEVPISTWSPWNPVAIKKMVPKHESDSENSDCTYSIAWSTLKYPPNKMVNIRAFNAFLRFFFNIEWCAHVTENPDLIKIIVFRRGTLMGLKGLISYGGHINPISILGLIPE